MFLKNDVEEEKGLKFGGHRWLWYPQLEGSLLKSSFCTEEVVKLQRRSWRQCQGKLWQEGGCRTAQELLAAASQGSFPWQQICLGKGLEADLLREMIASLRFKWAGVGSWWIPTSPQLMGGQVVLWEAAVMGGYPLGFPPQTSTRATSAPSPTF